MTKENTIWVKTKSGASLTMVLPDAKFTFDGNWKALEVTNTQLKWIQRQMRFLDISSYNPNAIQIQEPRYPLQGFELSNEELIIVKGDNVVVKITYLPLDTDVTQFNPIIRTNNPKIASISLLSDFEMSVNGLNVGESVVTVLVGSWNKEMKIRVMGEPKFVSPKFEGVVGEEIELDLINADDARITVPENVTLVGDRTVVAKESGIYTIIASCLGRTFTTKLDVTERVTEDEKGNQEDSQQLE